MSKRALALAGLAWAGLCAPILAQSRDEARFVSLGAGRLEDRLYALSDQFGVQVVFRPEDVAGLATQPLRGAYDIDSAFAVLLEGTTLSAERSSAGVIIRRVAQEAMLDHARSTRVPERARTSAPIIVQGFRSSVASGLEYKRQALRTIDAVVAEDVARLPELNLAEALQRTPGLAITRDAGEGQRVSVRGLPPDLAHVEFNGVSVLGTSSNIDARGAVNRTRGFDFNLLPAEFIGAAAVEKSSSADTLEGGVAANISLRSPRASDFAPFAASLSASAGVNSLAEEVDPRATALISRRDASNRWGVLGLLSYNRRTAHEKGLSTVRWRAGGWGDLSAPGRVSPDVDAETIARLASDGDDALFRARYSRYDVYAREIERVSGLLALELAPNDRLDLNADLFISDYSLALDEYHISSIGLQGADVSDVGIEALQVVGNDIVYGAFTNVDIRSEYNRERNTTEMRILSIEADYQFSDDLSAHASFGISTSRFDRPVHDKIYLWSPGQDFSYDYRVNDRIGLNTYGFDLLDEEAWRLYQVRPREDVTENQFQQVRLSLTSTHLDRVDLKFGVDRRRFEFYGESRQTTDTSQRGARIAGFASPMPWDFTAGTSAPAGAPSSWLVGNSVGISAFGGDERPPLAPGSLLDVVEESTSVYGMAEFHTELFGLSARGDAGLRLAWTETQSSGLAEDDDGALTPISGRNDYFIALPSANLVFDLSPNVLWRTALGVDMSRPNPPDLGLSQSVSRGAQLISGGNIDLDPVVAAGFSTSLEYFGAVGQGVSLGFFARRIDGFIADQAVSLRYGDTGLPLDLLDGADLNADTIFTVTRPQNSPPVDVIGLELLAQHDFGFIAPGLANYGVSLNYAFVDGDTRYSIDGEETVKPLLGLSRHSANATLYYEDARFGVRLSANYRDRYLLSVPDGNGNDESGVYSALHVDLNATWMLNESTRLTFEAINLTNEPYDQYTDSSGRVYNYAETGTDYFLGLRLSF